MNPLKPDTDQQQDRDFHSKVVDLCTLTGGDKVPITRAESDAAVRLIFSESRERGIAVRGDEKT